MDTIEIFKLYGSILVNNDKANDSISKTEQKAGGLGTKLGAGIKTAAKWGAAIGGAAIVAGGALLSVANKASTALDRVDKMSQKIGISRKGFQEWDYVLSQSGADIEKMQVGMKTLVQRMDESTQGAGIGADAFASLGLSAIDSTGAMKSQEQMFDDTVTALMKLPEGAEKSRLAFELFGKAGTELMPMLNGAEGSVDELKKRAEELGLIMSDESVDAGVLFGDTMDDLKGAFASLGTKLGAEVMPAFIKMADWIIANLPQIKAVFSKVFKTVGSVVSYAISLFKTLYPTLKAIYDFISPTFPLIAKIVKTAFGTVTTIVEGVVYVFEKATGAIKKAYDWLTSWNNKDAKNKNVTVTETRKKGKKVDGSNRDGLAYVPFDGYISELHKGERVLTAQENKNGWGGNVNHTGTIRVEGINDSGQLVAVSKLLMNDMARQERRNR